MNEPIIKYPIFASQEEKAYQKYCELAKEYTAPLPYEKWLHDVKNVRVTC